MHELSHILAGAASVEITPDRSLFLSGYPHVPRYSTGVHDPLLSSALFIRSGNCQILLIANDIIYITAQSSRRVRKLIEHATGVPQNHILISATTTHSGPKPL